MMKIQWNVSILGFVFGISALRIILAFKPVFPRRRHIMVGCKFRIQWNKAFMSSTNEVTMALEEQLKAVEGRNQAIALYLKALDEEEGELERIKAEMVRATASTSNSTSSQFNEMKKDANNTVVIGTENNHNFMLLLGGGFVTSLVGLRQVLQHRQEKQDELKTLPKDVFSEATNTNFKDRTIVKQSSCGFKVFGIGTGGSNVIQHVYSNEMKDYDHVCEFIQLQEAEHVTNSNDHTNNNNNNNNNRKKTNARSKTLIQSLTIDTCNDTLSSKREKIQQALDTSRSQLSVLVKDAKLIVFALEASDIFSSIVSPATIHESKTNNSLVVCIVSTAFSFEGDKRIRRSKKTIDTLKHLADMTVIIPSNVILETVSKETPLKTVYSMVDRIVGVGVTTVMHLIDNRTGKDSSIRLWNPTPFDDVERRFKNSNSFGTMGIGKGEGENAYTDALLSAIAYPTLGEVNIQVKSVLCRIQGGSNMTQKDLQVCEEILHQYFGLSTQVFISASIDKRITDDVVSVVIIVLDH